MNKVVLITGVLGGIGSLIAETFKSNGYFVIGLDLNNKNTGCSDVFIPFDLDQYCVNQEYRTEINRVLEKKIPSLNVLINNAAVQILGKTEEIKLYEWSQTLNVNLTAPFLLSQFFLKKLENTKGCIINISSIHQQLTKKRFVSYATSKAALVGLTKSMSVDLQGIVRVNSISPAAIDTPMLHDGFNNDKKKIEELNLIHPLQRIGKPKEVAKLALLLAEDGLGFINGANIQIDGGISNVLKDLD
jgi:NAD(P)-dependent dehydrogenase (short-subunit alcohol dehydrogenase family)